MRPERSTKSRGQPFAVSNLISGVIRHKESGNPVAEVVVVLLDLSVVPASITGVTGAPPGTPAAAGGDPLPALEHRDVWRLYKVAKRIGSETTDAAGRFSFEITARDSDLAGENEARPNLLLVLAPDEPVLELKIASLLSSKVLEGMDKWKELTPAPQRRGTLQIVAIHERAA